MRYMLWAAGVSGFCVMLLSPDQNLRFAGFVCAAGALIYEIRESDEKG